jgi:Domain of unknown function (DUF4604)
MSFKGKNLQFEKKEPAFLRKLRGEITGSQTEDPDRHQLSAARPKKPKHDDEDDGPTYVLEGSSTTVSKAEYEEMVGKGKDGNAKLLGKSEEDAGNDLSVEGGEASNQLPSTRQIANVNLSLGPTRKRKMGRAIGDDPENETAQKPKTSNQTETDTKTPRKKKAKPALLSFDSDDDID